MDRTLTIVAAPPPDDGRKYEPDKQIDGMLAVVLPHRSETHRIERAWSVERLGKVLRGDLAANEPPARVQIIGHGRPGLLALGMTWTGSMRGARGTYLLDGNPYDYGVLLGCVKRPTRVFLLGCETGSLTTTTEVADGASLVFDLSRLWDCPVSAPEDLVLPEHFENGLYTRTSTLVTADELKVERAIKGKSEVPLLGIGAFRS